MKITVETNEDTGKSTIDVDGILSSKEEVGSFISLLQTVGYQVFQYAAEPVRAPPPRPRLEEPAPQDREPF